MKIAIAGAFGFIGKHVIKSILDQTDHDVIALSRSAREAEDDRIECRSADLYSMAEARHGLEGADAAIYLVHSMAPSSRLSQGNFRDFDFILADNFIRAASSNGIKHVVYVGGMISEDEDLSVHLESRLEVEDTLRSRSIPVTALRCGMVIGPSGSSFSILVHLTERLPVMILPQWMHTRCSPIYVDDLAAIVVQAIERPAVEHRIIDAGMSGSYSYKDILTETAAALGRTPRMIDVPYISPRLSALWVRLVSGAPKALVYPLIESVEHKMVGDPRYRLPEEWDVKIHSLAEAVELTFSKPFKFTMPRLKPSVRRLSEVRSVQRMPLPKGRSALWVANSYFSWLPTFLKPFLRIKAFQATREYWVRFFSVRLLSLDRDAKISDTERQLFRVKRGALVQKGSRGRFEFRESFNRNFVIVALHNFKPALPWFIYRWTQAVIHKIVMEKFCRHVERFYSTGRGTEAGSANGDSIDGSATERRKATADLRKKNF